MLYAATDQYIAVLNKAFPDITFIDCRTDTLDQTIKRLSRFDILMFSNGYAWFVKNVQPKLPPKTLLVRVMHGSSHKFTDDATFLKSNVYAWDALITHGKKDLDVFYDFHKVHKDKRTYNEILAIKREDQSSLMIIQAGNFRVRHFLEQGPSLASIQQAYSFIDPAKKTLLFMPTTPMNAPRTINTYSGLSMALDLLEQMDDTSPYNILFKLHPNLIKEQGLLQRLKKVCQQQSIPTNYEMFTADYLPLMRIADLLIADRTSAVFDFLFFDKPIIFLDNMNECPEKIGWDDIRNPYWSFQCGPVIKPGNQTGFAETLANNLEDTDSDIRRNCRDYAFLQSTISPGMVLQALLNHPKIASG